MGRRWRRPGGRRRRRRPRRRPRAEGGGSRGRALAVRPGLAHQAVVALAALVAAEEGAIELDAPVAEHSPPIAALRPRRSRRDTCSPTPRACPSRRRESIRWRSSRHGRRASGGCYSNEGFHVARGADRRGHRHRPPHLHDEAVFDAAAAGRLPAAAGRRVPGGRSRCAIRAVGGPACELFNAPEWRRRGTRRAARSRRSGRRTPRSRVGCLPRPARCSAESHAELRVGAVARAWRGAWSRSPSCTARTGGWA